MKLGAWIFCCVSWLLERSVHENSQRIADYSLLQFLLSILNLREKWPVQASRYDPPGPRKSRSNEKACVNHISWSGGYYSSFQIDCWCILATNHRDRTSWNGLERIQEMPSLSVIRFNKRAWWLQPMQSSLDQKSSWPANLKLHFGTGVVSWERWP